MRFVCWYINLEEPFRRTRFVFDYLDQLLDIIVSPDRTTWQWKDEDEFQEAQDRGLFSPEQARAIRAEGERVVQLLQANKPPFNSGWEQWRPDSAWSLPTLPEGWD